MHTPTIRVGLATLLTLTALISGCAASPTTPTTSPSATEATVAEPDSTPLKEVTITDDAIGVVVTPLAVVPNFEEGASEVTKAVLVKVRVEITGDYESHVGPSDLSITKRNQDLKYQTLGMSNPDDVVTAMKAAGFPVFTGASKGTPVTGWIGARMDPEVKSFDLVYDRAEQTVLTGDNAGSTIPEYQQVVKLEPAG